MSFDNDSTVNNACKTLLLDAGVRHPGQTIKVNKGRHKGFVGVIETIDWCEAEVRCEKNARWFSLWHKNDYFTVLDPSQAEPPKAARLETPPPGAPEPACAPPTSFQVSQAQTPPSSPLSWIPIQRKP